MGFHLAGSPEADAELDRSAFSLLTGMLLDQQVPMEKAFSGPYVLVQRLGGPIDAAMIAEYDPEEFAAICSKPPAIHRFPGAMAARVQSLARLLVEEYDGDAARVWTEAKTAKEALKRLQKLPGFGEAKAKIFLALLAKQLDVKPTGWKAATAPYGNAGFRSVADVVDQASLLKVRAYKKDQKAAAKAAAAG
ncbi:HhH-GPD-type base excision DNA repair protein [Tenggerimyces flavus]|uniref:HhH-GPD-type base excision DNA repair protein n=1 Tax=Tenggerimyces flavus TaxID=1708749 RepID=A0ABV7YCN5_9ACTN|nr:HhH-GPD-type base excision DNA repair protein [Tenggerimyces flavus]MBM7787200.1 putative HhH-GPD family protein [Tenggerimyces flavus]